MEYGFEVSSGARFRADLAVLNDDDSIRLLIEVAASHKVSEVKSNELRHPWFEVNAADIKVGSPRLEGLIPINWSNFKPLKRCKKLPSRAHARGNNYPSKTQKRKSINGRAEEREHEWVPVARNVWESFHALEEFKPKGKWTSLPEEALRVYMTCPRCSYKYPLVHSLCGLHVEVKTALSYNAQCPTCAADGRYADLPLGVADCPKCGLECRSVEQAEGDLLRGSYHP